MMGCTIILFFLTKNLRSIIILKTSARLRLASLNTSSRSSWTNHLIYYLIYYLIYLMLS